MAKLQGDDYLTKKYPTIDPLTYLTQPLLQEFEHLKLGIQAVPKSNPSGTMDSVDPHIPWDDPTCAVGSPLLNLAAASECKPADAECVETDSSETLAPTTPVIRRSDTLFSPEKMSSHPNMYGRIVVHSNYACKDVHQTLASVPSLQGSYATDLTLREAMAACAGDDRCAGLTMDVAHHDQNYSGFIEVDGNSNCDSGLLLVDGNKYNDRLPQDPKHPLCVTFPFWFAEGVSAHRHSARFVHALPSLLSGQTHNYSTSSFPFFSIFPVFSSSDTAAGTTPTLSRSAKTAAFTTTQMLSGIRCK